MAFPTVEERVVSEEGTATNTHTVTLPTNISAGDLLLVFWTNRGGDTSVRFPIGWTPFFADAVPQQTHTFAYFKEATGNEGASIDVEMQSTSWSVAVAYRITGHLSVAQQRPESSALLFPSGYENGSYIDEFRARLGSSTLPKETATEDPDGYNIVGTTEWVAATIAVPPSADAFPVVQDHSHSSETNVATSHTVELPPNISSGELLIALFGASRNNSDDISWPTGWTQFAFQGTPSAGNNRMAAAYREADGSEGSTITVTTTNDAESSHIVYRITGAASPGTTPPESATVNGESILADPPSLTFSGGSDKHLWIAAANSQIEYAVDHTTGNGSTPDPPSLTPTGGEKDYLWFALAAIKANSAITDTPTGYGDLQHADVFEQALGVTERTIKASSQNPDTYTFDASDAWVAGTVAIHPEIVSGDVRIKFDFS